MLTRELIERRLSNFWGYGSFQAPVWFIGMEEGLSPQDKKELDKRFLAADGKITIDMRRDMEELTGHMKWFRPPFPIQPAWQYPIALYLFLKNNAEPSHQEIREHQSIVLGDMQLKETTAIELMPLPSAKADDSEWQYGNHGVPGLRTRQEYIHTYKGARIQNLKALLIKYHPHLVIFYSATYLYEWECAIEAPLSLVTSQMYFVRTATTAFCAIPQGRARGMSYERIYEYGELVKRQVDLPTAIGAVEHTVSRSLGSARKWPRQHSTPSLGAQITASGPTASDTIRLLVSDNPKRGKSRLRFACYHNGMTVAQYIDAVRNRLGNNEAEKCLLDLQWDSDPKRNFIRIERNGTPVALRRTDSMSYGRTR
jgi:hypothetical protein